MTIIKNLNFSKDINCIKHIHIDEVKQDKKFERDTQKYSQREGKTPSI